MRGTIVAAVTPLSQLGYIVRGDPELRGGLVTIAVTVFAVVTGPSHVRASVELPRAR
jgi:hypothetical protein